MSDLITELHIIENQGNIFDADEYIIPLYQRSYSWEDKQLCQLIEDIEDIAEEENYYIGSLVVSNQNGRYEVVDGQQRLTSLYLLLNSLEIRTMPNLTFSCREKSNYTLNNIKDLLPEIHHNKLNKSLLEQRGRLDMDRIEPSILQGLKILSQELKRINLDRKAFIKKLERVIIYRIEVPRNTDLNRYFEIMNTRGEQLEQHDVLKARLMSFLDDEFEKELFATIWNACSDMTGYVQMHFTNKAREYIFGDKWNALPSGNWQDYRKEELAEATAQEGWNCRIHNLIDENFIIEDDEGCKEDNTRIRFESIIGFSHFLLHTLKVYINLHGIMHKKENAKIVDELLDDKKLLDAFNRVISCGTTINQEATINERDFARTFIICLLRTRFLFDEYIIKREYANDSVEGEWSLKSLNVSGKKSKKKAFYKNSTFIKSHEWDKTNRERTQNNVMIQSALRVSYTSPKVMHWITTLLIWLSENDCMRLGNNEINKFDEIAEDIAIAAVKENFFATCEENNYAMGTDTPHIVFNYLDYLLWRQDRDKSNASTYSDFVFEFRNSVEHWYPQNPSEGTFEPWDNGVDRFGNLCIVQRNINSKFSNMSPEAKKSTFEKMIARGSIKLRIMSELTKQHNSESASSYWKKEECEAHEKAMIRLLKRACQIDEISVSRDMS